MRTRLRSKATLLFLAFAVAIFAISGTAMALVTDTSGNTAPAPTIQSDKADYAPGELVTLTGSNWQPGESVRIVVNDTYGATWQHTADVTADASGNVTDSFNLPEWFVSDYDVTATGPQSGTATTTFTDGNVNVSGTVTDSATNLPISGATVTCDTSSGCNQTFTTTTNASGNYSFSQATGNRLSFDTNGPVTLTLNVSKSGYANGTITLTDVNNNTTRSGQNVALVPSTKKLTVTKSGAGTGTVTSSPAGINCGATCSANFNNGTSVTLTATPGANSTFNGWSGDGTGTTTRSVTMDADKSVSALFKANQAALNYTGPTSGTYGDKLTLSSSGGDGTGAVTYEATGTACELGTGADAGKLLITSGTGTCSVEVKKAGDNNYNAASSGPQTITVNKANQAALTVTSPNTGTFGEKLTMSASGGSTTGAITFNVVAGSDACAIVTSGPDQGKLEITKGTGTCKITATRAGNDNYNPVTSAEHTVTVSKANQAALTVTSPDDGTFGDHLPIVTSGGTTNGALSFDTGASTACQIDNDNKLEITSGTGTCSLTATMAGNDNYNPVTSDAHTVTVQKANQAALSITSPNTGTFGEHLTIVTSGGSGTGALSFQASGTACQIDANDKLEITSGTGTCSVTATKASDDNYNSATSDAHSVTVQKANQSALNYTGPTSGTYGDKLTLSSSGGDGTGAVTYEATGTACELGTGADAGKLLITSGTGTCSVEVKKAGDNNYNAASSGPQTITVNKANQSITFGPLSNQTVGATFTVSATASSNLPVSFSAGPMGTCTISGTNVSVTGPGTCTITAKQPGDNNYNAATDVSQSFNASYTFFGWLQPVDGDGTATGTVNMGKVGRTYPIKWQLKEYVNGSLQLISDTTAQALVSSMSGVAKKANCSTFVGSDALEEYTAGATQLRYDATSDQFIYNYKAPSSPVCQAFVVSKADGVNDKQANFNFTK